MCFIEVITTTSYGLDSEGITSKGITPEGITSEGITSKGIISECITPEDITSEGITSEDITSNGITSESSEVVMVEILGGLKIFARADARFFGGADSPSAPLRSQLLGGLQPPQPPL